MRKTLLGSECHTIRRGLTLLEVVVAIAVLGVLIGILIPAVQKVRASAVRQQSMNQLKQITLAIHNFGSAHTGRLPAMNLNSPYSDDGAVLVAILDFIERGQYVTRPRSPSGNGASNEVLWRVRTYISPADPSFSYYPDDSSTEEGNCSYAVNMQAFGFAPHLDRTFSDGTANTIALAEHYARCAARDAFAWNMAGVGQIVTSTPSTVRVTRRATFADGEIGDVVPITFGNPSVAMGSMPNKTFQVAPIPKDCDGAIAQTPHTSGMLSAFMDGSVRTLAGSVVPAIYWAAVTPNGGEIIPSDW